MKPEWAGDAVSSVYSRFLTHTVQMKRKEKMISTPVLFGVLNPHGSDETGIRRIYNIPFRSWFLTHTVQMKLRSTANAFETFKEMFLTHTVQMKLEITTSKSI